MSRRSFIRLVIVGGLLIAVGCDQFESKDDRVARLLREIGEIGRRSTEVRPAADVMRVIQRINENKRGFPATREELKVDADLVVEWFTENEKESRLMDAKYDELLDSVSDGRKAICFRALKDINALGIEEGALVISQYRLFWDESIRNLEDLESRIQESNTRVNMISQKKANLEQVQKWNCPVELK